MARDLDFHRHHKVTPVPQPPISSKPQGIPTQPLSHAEFFKPEKLKSSKAPTVSTKKSSFWNNLLVAILFIVVIVGIIYGIYFANKSIAPSAKITDSSEKSLLTTDPALAATASTSNAKQPLIVDIYNSGAGSGDLTTALNELKAAGYNPTNLGESQYQYNQTYIWYQPSYQAQAEQIATTLADRQVTTEPTAVTGSFNILIYLGVK